MLGLSKSTSSFADMALANVIKEKGDQSESDFSDFDSSGDESGGDGQQSSSALPQRKTTDADDDGSHHSVDTSILRPQNESLHHDVPAMLNIIQGVSSANLSSEHRLGLNDWSSLWKCSYAAMTSIVSAESLGKQKRGSSRVKTPPRSSNSAGAARPSPSLKSTGLFCTESARANFDNELSAYSVTTRPTSSPEQPPAKARNYDPNHAYYEDMVIKVEANIDYLSKTKSPNQLRHAVLNNAIRNAVPGRRHELNQVLSSLEMSFVSEHKRRKREDRLRRVQLAVESRVAAVEDQIKGYQTSKTVLRKIYDAMSCNDHIKNEVFSRDRELLLGMTALRAKLLMDLHIELTSKEVEVLMGKFDEHKTGYLNLYNVYGNAKLICGTPPKKKMKQKLMVLSQTQTLPTASKTLSRNKVILPKLEKSTSVQVKTEFKIANEVEDHASLVNDDASIQTVASAATVSADQVVAKLADYSSRQLKAPRSISIFGNRTNSVNKMQPREFKHFLQDMGIANEVNAREMAAVEKKYTVGPPTVVDAKLFLADLKEVGRRRAKERDQELAIQSFIRVLSRDGGSRSGPQGPLISFHELSDPLTMPSQQMQSEMIETASEAIEKSEVEPTAPLVALEPELDKEVEPLLVVVPEPESEKEVEPLLVVVPEPETESEVEPLLVVVPEPEPEKEVEPLLVVVPEPQTAAEKEIEPLLVMVPEPLAETQNGTSELEMEKSILRAASMHESHLEETDSFQVVAPAVQVKPNKMEERSIDPAKDIVAAVKPGLDSIDKVQPVVNEAVTKPLLSPQESSDWTEQSFINANILEETSAILDESQNQQIQNLPPVHEQKSVDDMISVSAPDIGRIDDYIDDYQQELHDIAEALDRADHGHSSSTEVAAEVVEPALTYGTNIADDDVMSMSATSEVDFPKSVEEFSAVAAHLRNRRDVSLKSDHMDELDESLLISAKAECEPETQIQHVETGDSLKENNNFRVESPPESMSGLEPVLQKEKSYSYLNSLLDLSIAIVPAEEENKINEPVAPCTEKTVDEALGEIFKEKSFSYLNSLLVDNTTVLPVSTENFHLMQPQITEVAIVQPEPFSTHEQEQLVQKPVVDSEKVETVKDRMANGSGVPSLDPFDVLSAQIKQLYSSGSEFGGSANSSVLPTGTIELQIGDDEVSVVSGKGYISEEKNVHESHFLNRPPPTTAPPPDSPMTAPPPDSDHYAAYQNYEAAVGDYHGYYAEDGTWVPYESGDHEWTQEQIDEYYRQHPEEYAAYYQGQEAHDYSQVNHGGSEHTQHYDPNSHYDPNAYHDPNGHYDPNAYHDPNSHYNASAYHDPNAYYDPNDHYDPNSFQDPNSHYDHNAYHDPNGHYDPNAYHDPSGHHGPNSLNDPVSTIHTSSAYGSFSLPNEAYYDEGGHYDGHLQSEPANYDPLHPPDPHTPGYYDWEQSSRPTTSQMRSREFTGASLPGIYSDSDVMQRTASGYSINPLAGTGTSTGLNIYGDENSDEDHDDEEAVNEFSAEMDPFSAISNPIMSVMSHATSFGTEADLVLSKDYDNLDSRILYGGDTTDTDNEIEAGDNFSSNFFRASDLHASRSIPNPTIASPDDRRMDYISPLKSNSSIRSNSSISIMSEPLRRNNGGSTSTVNSSKYRGVDDLELGDDEAEERSFY